MVNIKGLIKNYPQDGFKLVDINNTEQKLERTVGDYVIQVYNGLCGELDIRLVKLFNGTPISIVRRELIRDYGTANFIINKFIEQSIN